MPYEPILAEALLIAVSSLSFFWIYVSGWLAGLWHLLACVWRRVFGRPIRADWARLSVLLPVGILVVLGIVNWFQGIFGTTQIDPRAPSVLVPTLMALVLSPVIATLLVAARRGRSLWLYANGLAAVVALPFAMTLATMMVVKTVVPDTGREDALVHPDFFVREASPPACTAAMIGWLGMDTVQPGPDAPAPEYLRDELIPVMLFWVDATLKAVFLDAFEVFGCGVTVLEHNQENGLLSAVIFGYRTMAAVVVLAVLLSPVLVPLRKTRTGLRLAARRTWSAVVDAKRGRQGMPPESPAADTRPVPLPFPGDPPCPRPRRRYRITARRS